MYKKHNIHFIGIGGVGMSGIAEVLLNLKYSVSGSDLKRSSVSQKLKKKGARIHYGHRAGNLQDAEVVVVSSAIRPDNPELMEAKEKKLPIMQRAEMLAELMRFSRYGIAVSGTHGKTTTTSLVASVLYQGKLDPTVIIGGRVNSFRSNARLGKGDFMVAEADESDGSFLKLSPAIAVITNIDREHMDYYQDFERVKDAYLQFAAKIPFYGTIVACVDHPVVNEIIPRIEKRVTTYGFSEGARYRAINVTAHNGSCRYELMTDGHSRGSVTIGLSGRHNVLNSLAAIAVADEVGLPLKKTASALSSFKGIHRRMEVLLKNANFVVLDDYGHHPEEIKATLQAVREAYPERRMVCLFQPHRYTRTRDLFIELAGAFDAADEILMTDIYAAGESPIDDINSKKLVEAMKPQRGENVLYVPKNKDLVSFVTGRVRAGDVLISLGAGDVTKMGRECAIKLKKQTSPS